MASAGLATRLPRWRPLRQRRPAPAPSLGIGRAPAPGSIAAEVSAASGADVAAKMAGLMSLMSQHAVDLRSQPMEVREAVAADCRAQGVDMQVGQSLNITDPSRSTR